MGGFPLLTTFDIKEIMAGCHCSSIIFRYRQSDDIFAPYGISYRRTTSEGQVAKFPHPLHKPGHIVAWMASKCAGSNGRLSYVHFLKRYIDVKIFGRCGEPCPTGNERNRVICLHCGCDLERSVFSLTLKVYVALCRKFMFESNEGYCATCHNTLIPVRLILRGRYFSFNPYFPHHIRSKPQLCPKVDGFQISVLPYLFQILFGL